MNGETQMRRAVKRALQAERERLGETREAFCFNLSENINAGESAIDTWLSGQKCIGGGNLWELVAHFGPGFEAELFSELHPNPRPHGMTAELFAVQDAIRLLDATIDAIPPCTPDTKNIADFPGAKEAGET